MAECAKHGQFIGVDSPCPVCKGRSTGRTWSTVRGPEIRRRRRAEAGAADDPFEMAVDPEAPEIERAWQGE